MIYNTLIGKLKTKLIFQINHGCNLNEWLTQYLDAVIDHETATKIKRLL